MSGSTEQREIALLDKVELRIALTDTEEKLQTLLGTYLAPILLKLGSEHTSVRNKVISICQQVNGRIKPQDIQLPVEPLLKQFKENRNSQLISHFDLLYIQQGITRLTASDRAALLPALVSNIANDDGSSGSHADVLFNLFLRVALDFQFPPKGSPEDDTLRSQLTLSDPDAEFLSFWTARLLLMRSSSPQAPRPGLSSSEFEFLTLKGKPDVWNPAVVSGLSLTHAKIAALRLISSGAILDKERLFPALIAAADPNSRISDTGNELLKRSLPSVDTENRDLLQAIFDLYFTLRSSGDGENVHTASALQVKLLNLFCRSKASTTFTQQITRIVSEDLVNTLGSGRQALLLRGAVVQFVTFVARNATADDLDSVSRPVIESLKDFLDQQHMDERSPEMKSLKGRSYEVIGLLSNKTLLLTADFALLRWLFRSLAEESDKDVVFSIDEALSACLRPLQLAISPETTPRLRQIFLELLHADTLNPRNTKFACLRFANRCLSYDDISARWIDLLAIVSSSSESHEIVEEARKGLDPHWHMLLKDDLYSQTPGDGRLEMKTPDFASLVKSIFEDNADSLRNAELRLASIEFCRRCLYWSCMSSAGTKIEFVSDWERRMDLALSDDQELRKNMRNELTKLCLELDSFEATKKLFEAALQGLCDVNSVSKARATLAGILLELVTLGPETLLARVGPQSLALLVPVLLSNDFETRKISSHCFGLLASQPNTDSKLLEPIIDDLLKKIESRKGATGAALNQIHGSILALAYFASRQQHRIAGSGKDSFAQHVARRLLPNLINMLQGEDDSLLQDASLVALGQLSIFSAINEPQISEYVTIDTLIDKIAKKAKSGDETAIRSLGEVSVLLSEPSQRQNNTKAFEKLRECHEIRQVDSQFAVGEALTYLAFGWDSSALRQNIDTSAVSPPGRHDQSVAVAEGILEDCKTTKPSLRKAAVIWLLCLLQFSGERAEIQERLGRFQAAFKRCLSDRDELVQESASRGLGLCYERGSRELRDDLVRDLVGSFSGNRADMSGTVTADTQLFEPGALPTGDGSITTYKDIMSLASEVGDSSLVYKFMSLASHNAIWTSRAAFGRFGLSNVLSDSSVDGYLANNPKLYPKLYRYKFDPNSNVRKAMGEIWQALVKDSAATIEQHFDAIMEDLLGSIVGREWRTRQASCAAIADLIQGRPLDKLQPYLERVWNSCFKVLDDIKESVRGSAAELARVLTSMVLRNLEGAESKNDTVRDLLKSVFPFLLSTSGLESSAKEVQMLSLQTLLEIIKKGRPQTLRPFIPDLVERLLGLLSTFESEAVNYLSLNTSNYNLKQSDIDDFRLKSIRTSPLMEAIERCLDMLDGPTMAATVPSLNTVLRTAVGVPSKVGVSRVFVSLSTRKNLVFKAHAGKFLPAVEKRLMDRNETVSSSYAGAMGYMMRLATDDEILRTIKHVIQLYFGDSDDDRSRFVAGEILQSMAKHATDRYQSLAADILPFVFFGKFDDEERVRNVFKETFDETVSGPRVISLHLKEIVELAQGHLSSKKWAIKHAAALALAEATVAVSDANSTVNDATAELLWPHLRSALAEKSWDGKERVLQALVAFTEKAAGYWQKKAGVTQEIVKIAIREARRRNRSYQIAAIQALSKLAGVIQAGTSFSDEAYAIAQNVLAPDDDEMELDDEKGNVLRDRLRGAVVEAAFTTLLAEKSLASPDSVDAAPDSNLLEGARRIVSLVNHVPIDGPVEAQSLFAGVETLAQASQLNKPDKGHATLFGDMIDTVLRRNSILLAEKPRQARAQALLALSTPHSWSEAQRRQLDRLVDDEKALAVHRVLAEAQSCIRVAI